MTVTNKFVVSTGDFNMVFMLLTAQARRKECGFDEPDLSSQSVISVVFLQAFKFLNLIKFRDFSVPEAKKWFPIIIFLVAMIYSGSKALQFLSIPVYTIFKNLTIILIAYGEVLWFGGNVTMLMILSFFLMTLSSVIAGWFDVSNAISIMFEVYHLKSITSTLTGYFWMNINCLSSAAFVLYMRKRIKLTNFGDFDTVYYNNLLSIPLLAIPSLLLEDWSGDNLALNFPPDQSVARIWAIIFSGASAFAMSYSSAWCVRTTSSTTYSMVGSLNKLPIAVSGIVFFGDPATWGNISAILIGFVAGVVYSYAKAFRNGLPSPTGQNKGYDEKKTESLSV
ncbi:GDP-mannose transporter into the lumen of the Golgi [Apophysomyces sp. BC1034]|nr:GDP-mannose transporter into the lumen of the Golgi [Apophysomyces sp. BC1034]